MEMVRGYNKKKQAENSAPGLADGQSVRVSCYYLCNINNRIFLSIIEFYEDAETIRYTLHAYIYIYIYIYIYANHMLQSSVETGLI